MKALLINGSPRPNGCTFTALTELANTLEAEGIETEIVHVGNKDIRGLHRLPPLPQHRLQQVRL